MLAELEQPHPTDDSLPATEEWLRSVGFLPDDADPDFREFSKKIWSLGEHTDYGKHPAMHYTVSMIDGSTWLEAYSLTGKSLCLVELQPNPTRGSVRRLFAALGQPLKCHE